MKVIYRPRAAGKTTTLMEWLKENQEHILIVFSVGEKQRIIKEYAKEELETGEPLPDWVERIYTPFELTNSHGKFTGKEKFSIDNADMILEQMLRKSISIMSLTKETPEGSE